MRQSARLYKSHILWASTLLLALPLTSCAASSAQPDAPTWITPAAAGTLGALFGFAISVYAGWRSGKQARRAAEQARQRSEERFFQRLSQSIAQDRDPPSESGEGRLVRVANSLERFGNIALGPRPIDEPPRTIFELRTGLVEAGIWTNADVATFDRVIRARNAVVHGDTSSRADIRKALADGLRLLNQTMEDREPHRKT